MLLELASFASRNEQAKGLHETADLIGELGRDLHQPVPRRHQRARKHAVEALDPHFTKKPRDEAGKAAVKRAADTFHNLRIAQGTARPTARHRSNYGLSGTKLKQ